MFIGQCCGSRDGSVWENIRNYLNDIRFRKCRCVGIDLSAIRNVLDRVLRENQ